MLNHEYFDPRKLPGIRYIHVHVLENKTIIYGMSTLKTIAYKYTNHTPSVFSVCSSSVLVTGRRGGRAGEGKQLLLLVILQLNSESKKDQIRKKCPLRKHKNTIITVNIQSSMCFAARNLLESHIQYYTCNHKS